MTSAVYLENNLDSLEHLPIELLRNFTLMKDLDTRARDLMQSIDRQANTYLQNVRGMGSDKRKEQMEKIQSQFNKAKEYGDDKVQLAIQTYELVDKHIRRLDSDLARFETEIHDKAASNTRNQEESGSQKRGRKKIKEKDIKKKVGASSEDESTKVPRKKAKKAGAKATSGAKSAAKGAGAGSAGNTSADGVVPGLAHPSDVLDMPVDPNEPTYCLCHQVSYGEMIGCDNPDCPVEWFHFPCVELTTKPKGKWFCPKCSADRKKK
ncbi:hypothetical protein FOCC_FOCC008214 [Frankliniella occidentalis]|uniref:Inhibitor of growth protein n=1 Tax=Frankliniella occidentalis TaxID=133901 RepID=A0A6J1TRY8_FRAOC|nr:inhibitor of growth protein 5 [Frankliniella occidentalis]KAE8745148.1 hypothetical protein FOCC_FOCC008214 [Frankliniella occidentalis]